MASAYYVYILWSVPARRGDKGNHLALIGKRGISEIGAETPVNPGRIKHHRHLVATEAFRAFDAVAPHFLREHIFIDLDEMQTFKQPGTHGERKHPGRTPRLSQLHGPTHQAGADSLPRALQMNDQ